MSNKVKATFWILAFIISCIGIWTYFSISVLGGLSSTNIGVFGDSFGAVNSLLSGAALLGIVYTLYLQAESNLEQRRSTLVDSLSAQNTSDDALVQYLTYYIDNEIGGSHTAETPHIASAFSKRAEALHRIEVNRIKLQNIGD